QNPQRRCCCPSATFSRTATVWEEGTFLFLAGSFVRWGSILGVAWVSVVAQFQLRAVGISRSGTVQIGSGQPHTALLIRRQAAEPRGD
ncbi:MAG: hypothetical protein N2663_09195, partial [Chlorobi bacterium]|nr:hypothetical protein [Chlorobiota bacterium]